MQRNRLLTIFLVLWAAYPAPADDLSAYALEVVSIFGSNDTVATEEDIQDSRSRLSADANFVAIAGGNHAQFGAYGPQPGDGNPTISAAEQRQQIVFATLQLLQHLSPENPS